ncbi:MAG: hypothetical protein V1866_00575 [archaeon]
MNKKKRCCLRIIMLIALALSMLLISANKAKAEAGGCDTENYFCACGDRCHGPYESSTGFNILNTTVCQDGPDQSEYEYVQEITATDLNGTNFKGGDVIRVYAQFYCYAGDYISIAYSNTSIVSGSSWRNIYSSTCPGYNFIDVYYNLTLDRKEGYHALRAIIAYPGEPSMTCGYPSHTSSDTDDLYFKVNARPDIDAPAITGIYPSAGANFEYTEGLSIPLVVNATDETGIDNISINMTWASGSMSFTLTNSSATRFNTTLYNLTNASRYNVTIISRDDLNNTGTNTTYFFITNNAFLNITSPAFGLTYSYHEVPLRFKINDNNTPYQEVYYNLNSAGNSYLNETTRISNDESVGEAETNMLANISQLFVPQEDMTVNNISIRIGRESSNSFLNYIQIRNGTNQSDGTVLLEYLLNSSTVPDSGADWISINFSSSAILLNGTKYFILLTGSADANDYYSWEFNWDAYPHGNFTGNSTEDLLFMVHDRFKYNTTMTAAEGTNSLSVCEKNKINLTDCTMTVFETDTIPPSYTQPEETADPFEFGDSSYQFIYINVSDETSTISRAVINISGNLTQMNYSGVGGRYQYRWYINSSNLSMIRSFNYSIFVNDSVGNYNITPGYSFSVVDSLPPNVSATNYSPNYESLLDPNVTIMINATVTDYTRVQNVTLLYGFINTTSGIIEWSSAVMLNNTGVSSRYVANFTPTIEGNWSFMISSRDIYNNSMNTTQTNISIAYDTSWFADPDEFEEKFSTAANHVEIGNITINNTGDYELSFFLSKLSGLLTIFINETNISVPGGQAKIVNVSALAPADQNQYPFTLLVSCVNISSTPNDTVDGIVTVGQGGPYITLTEILYPTTAVQGQRKLTLNTTVKNIGNDTAYNITVNWTLPPGWTTTYNLSKSIASLLPYQSSSALESHGIQTSVGLNATIGMQNFTLTVDFVMEPNRTRPAPIIKTVEVTELETGTTNETVIITPPSSGGGGGGGGRTSGSGGGMIPRTLNYNLTIWHLPRTGIMRGQHDTVQINITNNNDVTFYNIKMSIDGFPSSRYKIIPDRISELGRNQTAQLNVTFEIPLYMGYSVNSLMLIFDGESRAKPNSSANAYHQESAFTLIISETDQSGSLACLTESESLIAEMERMNFTVTKVRELLAKARDAFDSIDYTQVKILCDEIKSSKEAAFSLDKKIKELEKEIKDAASQGYDMKGTARLLGLAKEVFQNGEYDQVSPRLDKAQESLALQVQTEDAKLGKRLFKLVKNYWWALLMAAIAGTIIAGAAYRKASIIKIKNTIDRLEKEDVAITELIKQLQQEHFVDKKTSTHMYNNRLEDYQRRLAEIAKEKIDLKHIQVRFFKVSMSREGLEVQKEEMASLIKALQQDYFVNSTIDKNNYDKTFAIYKKQLAEINKRLILQEHEEKEKNKERLKNIERMNK